MSKATVISAVVDQVMRLATMLRNRVGSGCSICLLATIRRDTRLDLDGEHFGELLTLPGNCKRPFGVRAMKICTLVALLALFATRPIFAGARNVPLKITTNEIVARLELRNFQRQALLAGYDGMRLYDLKNRKLHKHAEMLVRVTCDQDGSKHFDIVRERGWKAANTHVFRRMLESEAKLSRPSVREKAELTRRNYVFRLAGTAEVNGRQAYVLNVVPKRRDQFLFRGRIWIDSSDYALVRVEGEPAKRPSFWIRNIRFSHTYTKNGPLWFATKTESVTRVLFFGETEVTISYFDYQPHAIAQVSTPLADGVAAR